VCAVHNTAQDNAATTRAPRKINMRLQYLRDLRKFVWMKTEAPTTGFRHLRRPWIENPGWVAV